MHIDLIKPDVQQKWRNTVKLNVFTIAPPSGGLYVTPQSDLPKTFF